MSEDDLLKKSNEVHKRETGIPEEVLRSKDGPYKLSSKFQGENNMNTLPIFEDQLDQLFYNIKNYSLIVNKLDTYGNSIPLGSFCYAISFILIGFKESKVNKNVDKAFYYVIFLFGCIGQIMAGIFEYIKGRTFVSNLYLLYGIYFLSYFYFFNEEDIKIPNDKDIKAVYYGTWAIVSFPIFIGSVGTNVFYLVQTFVGCIFFIVRCIGEYKESDKMNEIASGILELITGFISLYICINQIINESFRFRVIPSLPLSKENEIDINLEN